MAKGIGKRSLGKKGSIQDIILIGVILLFAAVVILIGFKVTSEINDTVQASSLITANGKAASTTLTGFYPGVIDNSFLLLTIGLTIGSLILASLVRIHPIFIPVFIIALIFIIFLAGILSNIYQGMAENENLIAQADQLTFISKILNYLPIFVGVIGTIMMIVLYKSWEAAQ